MRLAVQQAVGRMGLHKMPSLPLMPLMVMLLLLQLNVIPTAYSDPCPCEAPAPGSNAVVLLEEHLSTTSTRANELHCCARHLLPHSHHNDSFSVVWSFKGKELKVVDGVEQKWPFHVSTFRNAYCDTQVLTSDGVRLNDAGVYSCLVTSSSGASVIKTFYLCININEDIGRAPLNTSISKNTFALLREKATFSCSAYVGEPRCENKGMYHLVWTKERPDGSWMEVTELSHTTVTTSGVEKGLMKSRVTINSVQSEHFGHYRCTVTNHNGNSTLNVTLTKGVTSLIRITGEYRAALVIIVAATMFLGTAVLLWRRCQVAFALHFRQKKTALSEEDYQYDVFLIHGESASSWTCSILLPALEDSFGYTCFLPQRDMYGGTMIIEEVAEAVSWCRCVVVVSTPCLLENPWAGWALHNAVKAALQARTRLLALLLQDMDARNGPPDTNGILGALKHVRKIPVPRSSRWEDFESKEESLPNNPISEEIFVSNGKNSVKTLKVAPTICRSRSKSPKNQKLSNMITGGNMTLRDTKKDKTEHTCRGRVVFLERQDSEDLNSPCSETPFIFPSAKVVRKDRSTLEGARLSLKKPSLSTFLRVLCTGDEQEVFWHTLLSWLGHPGITSKPQQHSAVINA